jgi:hypothetical protein
MFSPPKFFTTLFLGAVSGLGFYSMSSPVTRLSTVVTHYFFPSVTVSENGGSTVHKTDRGALRDIADGFEDRWRLSQFSVWAEKMWWQTTGSNEICCDSQSYG